MHGSGLRFFEHLWIWLLSHSHSKQCCGKTPISASRTSLLWTTMLLDSRRDLRITGMCIRADRVPFLSGVLLFLPGSAGDVGKGHTVEMPAGYPLSFSKLFPCVCVWVVFLCVGGWGGGALVPVIHIFDSQCVFWNLGGRITSFLLHRGKDVEIIKEPKEQQT